MKEENEKIVIVKTNAINPKTKSKDSTNQKGNNINGNYGRIYVQDGGKKNLIYSEFDVPESSDKAKLRGEENNTKTYNKINPNSRYIKNSDKTVINKNKGRTEGKNKTPQLRRKSIDRGGDYKNIKVTHIINTSKNIDFHIIEPLEKITEEKKKKFKTIINKSNLNGKNGKVIVICSCSCDNIKIKPKEKKEKVVKTQIISKRENPHLKRKDVNKTNNKGKNSMVFQKQRYNKI